MRPDNEGEPGLPWAKSASTLHDVTQQPDEPHLLRPLRA